MYLSKSHFHADFHAAPALCTCCVVSVLSLSGCSDVVSPETEDDTLYPAAVPSAAAPPAASEGNCSIDDDFC